MEIPRPRIVDEEEILLQEIPKTFRSKDVFKINPNLNITR
jgi:hypothetical protein